MICALMAVTPSANNSEEFFSAEVFGLISLVDWLARVPPVRRARAG
jgi:hypothetical protein